MKNKWILVTAIILFAAVFAFAGWKLSEVQQEYRAGEDAYVGLEEYVALPVLMPESSGERQIANQSEEEPPSDEVDATVWPVVDFDALREVNPDIVGWIYLEGTKINYPVVQGTDNSYYLKHMFEGKRNSAGCIFLDSRNEDDFSDRHNIIYGHHMKSGTMFSDLDKYKKQEFYDNHPTILLMTPEKSYRIELISGYVASVEEDAWELGFTQAGYETWLAETIERSCFKSTAIPEPEDCVVTLSTCSYEFDNARFVVVGILK